MPRRWWLVLFVIVCQTAMAADEADTGDDSKESLFNGLDLRHWIADPATVAHWYVTEGVLRTDGTGTRLVSEKNYRDFELTIDWKAPAGSSGGIYVRSRPKVAIEDPAMTETGSGGLINNKEHPNRPAVKADQDADEWNTFRIRVVGNKVTVHLNDQLVVDDLVMENAADSSRKLPVTGKIELEAKGPIEFRNIEIHPVESASP